MSAFWEQEITKLHAAYAKTGPEDRDYEALHAISGVLQRLGYGDCTDAEALEAIRKIIHEVSV